jgi:uncharacterized protein YbjT (DUF2867 family)
MTDSQQTTLVLGGTGRTGSLVAQKLIERGLNARTASRHDADVLFDWDDPTTHARALEGGAHYAPTGPQSLTVSEVADIIADVIGGPVTHNDIDADAWTVMLRWLTGTIISGNGSRPNDDI